MKPEEIKPGKTYLLDSGRKRFVKSIIQRYLGLSVDFQDVLKDGSLGSLQYCLLTTFARRAVKEVER